MIFKSCSKCGLIKEISMFNKAARGLFGVRSSCKLCDSEYKKKNRDAKSSREASKKWRETNIDRHRLYRYQKIDEAKGHFCDLTIEFIRSAIYEPCHYCGYIDPIANGLDRIDNRKGHDIENCVTCCKLCNTTRLDNYSYTEFKTLIAPAIIAVRKSRGEI